MNECQHYSGGMTPLHARRDDEQFLYKKTVVCCCGVAMVMVRSHREVEFNPVLNIRQRAAAVRALADTYRLKVVAQGSVLRAYPRMTG